MTTPAGASPAGGGVLQGKTALVTAAASGMGLAGALLFAAQGAHVIAADVNRQGCEDAVAEIVSAGGSAEAHAVDLGDRRALDAFLTTVETTHDVIDVLYNHVGITGPTRLDFDADAWDECMRINVWVPTAVTQRLVPLLRRSRSASIIFTSSQAGISGTAALPVYAASKGAVIQFMKSVALLLAPDGIRANAICPGLTNTAGMRSAFQDGLIEETLAAFAKTVPLGRVAEPQDVASVALFLASDASNYMTGTVLPVDGGVTAGSR